MSIHITRALCNNTGKNVLRLFFIFVVAFEDDWSSYTDFTTWVWLIFRCVIHFRNVHKFYLWEKNIFKTQKQVIHIGFKGLANIWILTYNMSLKIAHCLPHAGLGDPTWPDKVSPWSIELMTQEVSVIPYPSRTEHPKHLYIMMTKDHILFVDLQCWTRVLHS